MRRLMLLRHTKSDWPMGVEDHDRPLAKRGLRAGPLMGTYMASQGLIPDLVLVSTARRTQETWQLVQPALGDGIPTFDERRIYEASCGRIRDVIHEMANDIQSLLLVGHNPGLQALALDLISIADADDLSRLREKYPTGGLAVIDFTLESWKDVGTGAGRLERFVTPRSLGGVLD